MSPCVMAPHQIVVRTKPLPCSSHLVATKQSNCKSMARFVDRGIPDPGFQQPGDSRVQSFVESEWNNEQSNDSAQ